MFNVGKDWQEVNFPLCEGEVEATIVFYKGFAYESHPEDLELDKLVDKMMDEEELTDAELQVLEPVRIPSEDIVEVNGGRAGPHQ